MFSGRFIQVVAKISRYVVEEFLITPASEEFLKTVMSLLQRVVCAFTTVKTFQ